MRKELFIGRKEFFHEKEPLFHGKEEATIMKEMSGRLKSSLQPDESEGSHLPSGGDWESEGSYLPEWRMVLRS